MTGRATSALSLRRPTQRPRADQERVARTAEVVRALESSGAIANTGASATRGAGESNGGSAAGSAHNRRGSNGSSRKKKKRKMEPKDFEVARKALSDAITELAAVDRLASFMAPPRGANYHALIGSARVERTRPSQKEQLQRLALATALRKDQLESMSAALHSASTDLDLARAGKSGYFDTIRKLNRRWVVSKYRDDSLQQRRIGQVSLACYIDCSYASSGSAWKPRELGHKSTQAPPTLADMCKVGLSPSTEEGCVLVEPPPRCTFVTLEIVVERRRRGGGDVDGSTPRTRRACVRLSEMLLDASTTNTQDKSLQSAEMLLEQVRHSVFCEEIFSAMHRDVSSVGRNACHLSGAILDTNLPGQLAVVQLSDATIEVVIAKSSLEAGEETVLSVRRVPIGKVLQESDGDGTDEDDDECLFLARLAAQLSQYCIRGSWERIQSETGKARVAASRVNPLSMSVLAMGHFERRRELDRVVGESGCGWRLSAGELAINLCKDVLATGVCSPVSSAPCVTLAGSSTAPIVVKSGSRTFECLHVKEAAARLE